MAISLVAHTAAGSTNSGLSVTTPAIDTSGANLIVVHLSFYTTATAISDSYGNTWTTIQTDTTGSAHSGRQIYCLNPTVGAVHTFSTSGATYYPALCVSAWSGVATSAALDQFTQAMAVSPGSITPTVNNELVITSAFTGGGAPTVPSGYTLTDPAGAQVSGNAIGYGMAYQIQTTATATNPVWGGANGAMIASFKASVGGPAVAVQYRSLLGVGI